MRNSKTGIGRLAICIVCWSYQLRRPRWSRHTCKSDWKKTSEISCCIIALPQHVKNVRLSFPLTCLPVSCLADRTTLQRSFPASFRFYMLDQPIWNGAWVCGIDSRSVGQGRGTLLDDSTLSLKSVLDLPQPFLLWSPTHREMIHTR